MLNELLKITIKLQETDKLRLSRFIKTLRYRQSQAVAMPQMTVIINVIKPVKPQVLQQMTKGYVNYK